MNPRSKITRAVQTCTTIEELKPYIEAARLLNIRFVVEDQEVEGSESNGLSFSIIVE
jgi:hypothetical protein